MRNLTLLEEKSKSEHKGTFWGKRVDCSTIGLDLHKKKKNATKKCPQGNENMNNKISGVMAARAVPKTHLQPHSNNL